MMQLDVGLTPPLPASNLGGTAARGGRRIDPRPWLWFMLARSEFGCLTKRRRRREDACVLSRCNIRSFRTWALKTS